MDYTFDDYSRAVHGSGGAPVLLPVAQDRQSLSVILEHLDGLLLTGGPDINPKVYGEEPLSGLREIDAELDQMELAVTRAAMAQKLPVLAVCRGIQILNVAFGGSLYQDIERQIDDSLNHLQLAAKSVATHSISIEKPSRLRAIMQRKTIWVNGKHHQAIKDVADGLTVSARAADGVIEAVEHVSHDFVIGVQWHPEGSWRQDRYSKKLFKAFVRAAAHPS
jgi:putative glutamine amidotransferase